jgi:predicted RNase H-like nuclease (RuvC/YqgF family)
MLNENDANIEEKETPQESSTETKTTSSDDREVAKESKDSQTQEDLGSSRFSDRFKQIYGEKKRLERENEELKAQIKPVEAEEKDDIPATWDEAEEKLLTKFEQRQAEKIKADEAKLEKFQKQLNRELSETKKVYKDIDEDKLWDYMAQNGITNVFEAAAKMQTVNNSGNKEVSSKIGSGSKNTTEKPQMTYEQLHNTSLDDLSL